MKITVIAHSGYFNAQSFLQYCTVLTSIENLPDTFFFSATNCYYSFQTNLQSSKWRKSNFNLHCNRNSSFNNKPVITFKCFKFESWSGKHWTSKSQSSISIGTWQWILWCISWMKVFFTKQARNLWKQKTRDECNFVA